jgi:hypothetical protein
LLRETQSRSLRAWQAARQLFRDLIDIFECRKHRVLYRILGIFGVSQPVRREIPEA